MLIKNEHSRVIVLVWKAGQRKKNSDRKRNRTSKFKSREVRCWNVTQDIPRMLHQTRGTNVGIGSVARVRAQRPGQSPGEVAEGEKKDLSLARPDIMDQSERERLEPEVILTDACLQIQRPRFHLLQS